MMASKDGFNLEREDFMIRIKEYLDSKYKDEIAEKEERKRKRELVRKLMKEEGYHRRRKSLSHSINI